MLPTHWQQAKKRLQRSVHLVINVKAITNCIVGLDFTPAVYTGCANKKQSPIEKNAVFQQM